MAFDPYVFVRRILFFLDPELAHEATLNALALTPSCVLKWAFGNGRVQDPIELAGLKFPNRVGLAAGLDKNASCVDALQALGFGFVELGTVTPLAQPGNPRPRMFRLPEAHALINRMGFNNDGLDAFIANLKRSARHSQPVCKSEPSPMLLGLNIGKNAATPMERATYDYLSCLDGVYPYADYVTVNISSPNTKNLRSLQSDEALDGLMADISERRELLARQHGKQTPIFLKIAPDLDEEQVSVIAQHLKRYGTDSAGQVNNTWGIVATNTTLSRDGVQAMAHANETGGLSGAPLLNKSNLVIQQLRSALGRPFPIMGAGGIMTAEDAVSKIQAGADVVQIYTGLVYQGPGLIRQAATLIQKMR